MLTNSGYCLLHCGRGADLRANLIHCLNTTMNGNTNKTNMTTYKYTNKIDVNTFWGYLSRHMYIYIVNNTVYICSISWWSFTNIFQCCPWVSAHQFIVPHLSCHWQTTALGYIPCYVAIACLTICNCVYILCNWEIPGGHCSADVSPSPWGEIVDIHADTHNMRLQLQA